MRSLALLFSVSFAPSAFAQAEPGPAPGVALPSGGFDAHGFALSSFNTDLRDPLTFKRPGAMSQGDWYAGGLLEYASRPLLFDLGAPQDHVVALKDVVAANLAAGMVAADQVRFDLSMPLYFSSTGLAGPQGAGIGDLQLSTLVSLVQPKDGGLGVGLVAGLDVPTGDAELYLGDSGVAGSFGAALSFEAEKLTLAAQAGLRLGPSSDPNARPASSRGGDFIEVAGSGGYLVSEATGVTLEAHASVATEEVVRTAVGLPAEVLLGVRHMRAEGAHLSAALGVGIGEGAGASPLRILVGGGFGSSGVVVPVDTDGDGLFDAEDTCPEQGETTNGYLDDDGCPDELPSNTITATWGGEAAPEAKLTVIKSDNSEVKTHGGYRASGLPGQRLKVHATLGDCLVGDVETSLSDTDTTTEVPLARVSGTVEIAVFDSQAMPVEGATVRYITEDERCLPEDRSMNGAVGSHKVGIGEATVFITAEGYAVYRTTLQIEEGKRYKVEAVLESTSAPK